MWRAGATLCCSVRASHCGGLSLRSTGSRRAGFSSCGTRAQELQLAGSRAQAQSLWRTGLVTPQHMGSSWSRARTHVPFIGRQILFLNKFIYLFLAVLGLPRCARAFSSCSEQGLLFFAVRRLLTAVASRCGARALGVRASVVVAHGLQ